MRSGSAERIYGAQQQRLIETQRQYNEKLSQQLKRSKEKLWRQEALNYQLKRRINELEAAAVTKDSHNSSLPPSTDRPAAKALTRSGARAACGGLRGGGRAHSPGIKGASRRRKRASWWRASRSIRQRC
jgi:Family of unknown function (DUF6444)